jgi:hypothetical protein
MRSQKISIHTTTALRFRRTGSRSQKAVGSKQYAASAGPQSGGPFWKFGLGERQI